MITKYGIGGKITSVRDMDSAEEREHQEPKSEYTMVLLCKKCGIQHALIKNEVRACCGTKIDSSTLD